jgi:hypothetical protein
VNAIPTHGWILFPLMDECSFNSWMDVIRIYGWKLGVLYMPCMVGLIGWIWWKTLAHKWKIAKCFFLCCITVLVWTPCLMHRGVCIWRYILQNYNYKLHFQNLSTYHIPHVSIGTLAACYSLCKAPAEFFVVCNRCRCSILLNAFHVHKFTECRCGFWQNGLLDFRVRSLQILDGSFIWQNVGVLWECCRVWPIELLMGGWVGVGGVGAQ